MVVKYNLSDYIIYNYYDFCHTKVINLLAIVFELIIIINIFIFSIYYLNEHIVVCIVNHTAY